MEQLPMPQPLQPPQPPRSSPPPIRIISASAIKYNPHLIEEDENRLAASDVPVNMTYYTEPRDSGETHGYERPLRLSRLYPDPGYSQSQVSYHGLQTLPMPRNYDSGYMPGGGGIVGPRYEVSTFSGPYRSRSYDPLYTKRYYPRSQQDVRDTFSLDSFAVFAPPVKRRKYRVYTHNFPKGRIMRVTERGFERVSPLEEAGDSVWRLIIKVAEIIADAVVIGCVAAAAGKLPFYAFVNKTQTEGQLFVLIAASICLSLTVLLLAAITFLPKVKVIRYTDAILTCTFSVLYIAIIGVEVWYATCYPPFGSAHPTVCFLGQWTAASVFAIFAMLLYAMDAGILISNGVNVLQ